MSKQSGRFFKNFLAFTEYLNFKNAAKLCLPVDLKFNFVKFCSLLGNLDCTRIPALILITSKKNLFSKIGKPLRKNRELTYFSSCYIFSKSETIRFNK